MTHLNSFPFNISFVGMRTCRRDSIYTRDVKLHKSTLSEIYSLANKHKSIFIYYSQTGCSLISARRTSKSPNEKSICIRYVPICIWSGMVLVSS